MQGVHNSVPARNTPKRKDIYIFYTAQYQVESVYKQISYFRFYGSKSKNLSRSTDIMISRKLITNQGCCCCFLFFFFFFFHADEEQQYFMSCFVNGVKLVYIYFFLFFFWLIGKAYALKR